MKVDKPSEADKDNFVALFGEHPALEIKPMFGNLAAFVKANQQMCAGLFGASVGLRLAESDRGELIAVEGAGPFGPEGRPMKEYIAIPPAWCRLGSAVDGSDVDDWIDRAVAHTESLPPKKKKATKKKATKKKAIKKTATKKS